MYVVINIAGDPTSWWTQSVTDSNALAAELAQGPVNVEVFAPLKGNLLISRLAIVSIVDVLADPHSWIPSGSTAPIATMYLPSPAGVSGADPGYALPVGTDLGALSDQITSAMGSGGSVTVPVSSAVGSGVTLLNGASLSFALLCPPPAP